MPCTMVMVPRVQPRPFRVWSSGKSRCSSTLPLAAPAVPRSTCSAQQTCSADTVPAQVDAVGLPCPSCWPYLGVNCWFRLTRGASPLPWRGGHCVQHALWLSPRAARNAQSSCSDCAKKGRPASKFRPTMHFPYLVIPIGSFASNATGSHRAPPHATLWKKIAKNHIGTRSSGTWFRNKGTLKGYFPPSGTLYHFFSPEVTLTQPGSKIKSVGV
jgi:hypothetical protein